MAPGGATSLARRARRRSVGAAACTNRVVEICGMPRTRSANATRANGSSVVSMSTRALCARRAWASVSARPDLGRELTGEMALAVPEAAGKLTHAAVIDDAVGDQPHRPAHEIGALVPLRRSGSGVGPAPAAGAKARRLRRGGCRVEAHVRGLRRHRRTARSAVDAGRRDGREEPAIEPGVTALHRPIAALEVLDHPAIVTPRVARGWRKSDIAIPSRFSWRERVSATRRRQEIRLGQEKRPTRARATSRFFPRRRQASRRALRQPAAAHGKQLDRRTASGRAVRPSSPRVRRGSRLLRPVGRTHCR